MATVIIFQVIVQLRVRLTYLYITLVTHKVNIAYLWGRGSSWTIRSKIYYIVAAIFTGVSLEINFHVVVSCCYLKYIMRQLDAFVFHRPPPLVDNFLFFAFNCFSMDGSGRRVDQSCQSFQKFVEHLQHKTIQLQTLLLLNQAVVGNVVIIPYQINCMEHYWNPNT